MQRALQEVSEAVPLRWRRACVERSDLNRFTVESEHMVMTLAQDGIVANVAKYLSGQPVVGINRDPEEYQEVLSFFNP